MKRLLLCLSILLGFHARAQHTISGTFSPANSYSWLIAYRLGPGSQNYAADTSIKQGKFELQVPVSVEPGVLRLVYAVPQEDFYFDVFYDGKEDVVLHFTEDEGAVFESSRENVLFQDYVTDIVAAEMALIQHYSSGATDPKGYTPLLDTMRKVQQDYETQAQGLWVYPFVKSNRPYTPKSYEPVQEYVGHKKTHYFDDLDPTDVRLQASGFLKEKLTNFVFTALPLKQMTVKETQAAIQENLGTLAGHLQGAEPLFKLDLYRSLYNQALDSGYADTADYIADHYIRDLAKTLNQDGLIAQLEAERRLRIGAEAPEIVWEENGKRKSLSGMKGASRYLLVFWSSTCSHCLKQLPPLHKKLKEFPDVKVLAVGLEDEKENWEKESAKLPDFEHAISLGKWDSEYAELYDVHGTPTYYLLDADKHIIAKPEDDKAVIELLEQGNAQ